MHSYIIKNEKDYRTAVNGQGHGVILIQKVGEIEKAFGYFKNIDEDMITLSEREEAEINAILNPTF
ncbi:MAG: hypothetical protein JW802_05550 [Campylobacterales bacterium]|nr:hypothetical protein [Campylobacterales bacterium]MBN2832580.1 hypothetical protein [Campylobacterales bacterium]